MKQNFQLEVINFFSDDYKYLQSDRNSLQGHKVLSLFYPSLSTYVHTSSFDRKKVILSVCELNT